MAGLGIDVDFDRMIEEADQKLAIEAEEAKEAIAAAAVTLGDPRIEGLLGGVDPDSIGVNDEVVGDEIEPFVEPETTPGPIVAPESTPVATATPQPTPEATPEDEELAAFEDFLADDEAAVSEPDFALEPTTDLPQTPPEGQPAPALPAVEQQAPTPTTELPQAPPPPSIVPGMTDDPSKKAMGVQPLSTRLAVPEEIAALDADDPQLLNVFGLGPTFPRGAKTLGDAGHQLVAGLGKMGPRILATAGGAALDTVNDLGVYDPNKFNVAGSNQFFKGYDEASMGLILKFQDDPLTALKIQYGERYGDFAKMNPHIVSTAEIQNLTVIKPKSIAKLLPRPWIPSGVPEALNPTVGSPEGDPLFEANRAFAERGDSYFIAHPDNTISNALMTNHPLTGAEVPVVPPENEGKLFKVLQPKFEFAEQKKRHHFIELVKTHGEGEARRMAEFADDATTADGQTAQQSFDDFLALNDGVVKNASEFGIHHPVRAAKASLWLQTLQPKEFQEVMTVMGGTMDMLGGIYKASGALTLVEHARKRAKKYSDMPAETQATALNFLSAAPSLFGDILGETAVTILNPIDWALFGGINTIGKVGGAGIKIADDVFQIGIDFTRSRVKSLLPKNALDDLNVATRKIKLKLVKERLQKSGLKKSRDHYRAGLIDNEMAELRSDGMVSFLEAQLTPLARIRTGLGDDSLIINSVIGAKNITAGVIGIPRLLVGDALVGLKKLTHSDLLAMFPKKTQRWMNRLQNSRSTGLVMATTDIERWERGLVEKGILGADEAYHANDMVARLAGEGWEAMFRYGKYAEKVARKLGLPDHTQTINGLTEVGADEFSRLASVNIPVINPKMERWYTSAGRLLNNLDEIAPRMFELIERKTWRATAEVDAPLAKALFVDQNVGGVSAFGEQFTGRAIGIKTPKQAAAGTKGLTRKEGLRGFGSGRVDRDVFNASKVSPEALGAARTKALEEAWEEGVRLGYMDDILAHLRTTAPGEEMKVLDIAREFSTFYRRNIEWKKLGETTLREGLYLRHMFNSKSLYGPSGKSMRLRHITAGSSKENLNKIRASEDANNNIREVFMADASEVYATREYNAAIDGMLGQGATIEEIGKSFEGLAARASARPQQASDRLREMVAIGNEGNVLEDSGSLMRTLTEVGTANSAATRASTVARLERIKATLQSPYVEFKKGVPTTVSFDEHVKLQVKASRELAGTSKGINPADFNAERTRALGEFTAAHTELTPGIHNNAQKLANNIALNSSKGKWDEALKDTNKLLAVAKNPQRWADEAMKMGTGDEFVKLDKPSVQFLGKNDPVPEGYVVMDNPDKMDRYITRRMLVAKESELTKAQRVQLNEFLENPAKAIDEDFSVIIDSLSAAEKQMVSAIIGERKVAMESNLFEYFEQMRGPKGITGRVLNPKDNKIIEMREGDTLLKDFDDAGKLVEIKADRTFINGLKNMMDYVKPAMTDLDIGGIGLRIPIEYNIFTNLGIKAQREIWKNSHKLLDEHDLSAMVDAARDGALTISRRGVYEFGETEFFNKMSAYSRVPMARRLIGYSDNTLFNMDLQNAGYGLRRQISTYRFLKKQHSDTLAEYYSHPASAAMMKRFNQFTGTLLGPNFRKNFVTPDNLIDELKVTRLVEGIFGSYNPAARTALERKFAEKLFTFYGWWRGTAMFGLTAPLRHPMRAGFAPLMVLDKLNYTLSGHHAWENEKGRRTMIEVNPSLMGIEGQKNFFIGMPPPFRKFHRQMQSEDLLTAAEAEAEGKDKLALGLVGAAFPGALAKIAENQFLDQLFVGRLGKTAASAAKGFHERGLNDIATQDKLIGNVIGSLVNFEAERVYTGLKRSHWNFDTDFLKMAWSGDLRNLGQNLWGIAKDKGGPFAKAGINVLTGTAIYDPEMPRAKARRLFREAQLSDTHGRGFMEGIDLGTATMKTIREALKAKAIRSGTGDSKRLMDSFKSTLLRSTLFDTGRLDPNLNAVKEKHAGAEEYLMNSLYNDVWRGVR